MKNSNTSKNKQIQSVGVDLDRLGVIIAPIIPNYNFDDDKSIEPHRHDYYGIFYVSKGEMMLHLDDSVMNFKEETLAVIYPNQVHEILTSEIKSGWVLFFEKSIAEKILYSQGQENILENVLFELSTEDTVYFNHLFEIILKEVHKNKSTFNLLYLVHSLIQACILKLCCLHNEKFDYIAKNGSKSKKDLTRLFLQELKNNFLTLKQASDYSSILKVTTSHLNDTLKKTLGKTTTSLIQNEIITEAQRQLLYSNKNIEELSFYLGYDDPKYFIRLFSRLAGVSPAKYRKLQVNNSIILK